MVDHWPNENPEPTEAEKRATDCTDEVTKGAKICKGGLRSRVSTFGYSWRLAKFLLFLVDSMIPGFTWSPSQQVSRTQIMYTNLRSLAQGCLSEVVTNIIAFTEYCGRSYPYKPPIMKWE
jgi:hypothetical protein